MALTRSPPFESQLRNGRSFLEAVAGERHLHGEHVVRIEAGIDVAQRDEGANEQRGANEQDECERDFADDQQGSRDCCGEIPCRNDCCFP